MTKPYEIKIIQKQEKKEIIQFMRKYFMPDEPINTSINLVTEDKPFNEPLEEFLIKGYDSGVSLKAVQNGKLIAICISYILEKNEKHEQVESDNKDFMTIYNFLTYVDEHCNAFGEFPECDRAITSPILAVHPSYRGLGIARDMMYRILETGKEKKCGFMVVECSSHFTALALQKLNFECIYRLPYEDYKVDDKIVFKTKPPHNAATVYVKKID
ncbi:arylalkylamine N-acetyltransferase 1-like [Diorhabda sublineata]|uniref:arylalkylamine N-acetyltransferase 1-like n=1 Tax=Diorhabda sublineata TaxID=1163346 RepID=UPI0024E154A4|nr:arylalkylamine N-acetyltransferase 1-like [Diorhabda sublineata]XP_056637910.1 arylalkylamine N-acetyltransferase 1-like [Diorhabda sublineata]